MPEPAPTTTPEPGPATPAVPGRPPAPAVYPSLHFIFLGGDRWTDARARAEGGVTYLDAIADSGRTHAVLALSGGRAAVGRAVEDLARALAALPEEGAGT